MGLNTRPFTEADLGPARAALAACRAFSDEEAEVASDMIEAGLAGRYVLLAIDEDDVLAGYSCLGPAPLSRGAWYLYWICLRPDAQGRGLGRTLQAASEAVVVGAGATQLVLETGGRPDYAPVRRFYRRLGFVEAGRLADFYSSGDDCVIYRKALGRGGVP